MEGLSGRESASQLSLGINPSIQSVHLLSCVPPLCDPMDCSMPGFPVLHQLPEFAQTHVHQVSDAIQPSHPLLSPSPPARDTFKNKQIVVSKKKREREREIRQPGKSRNCTPRPSSPPHLPCMTHTVKSRRHGWSPPHCILMAPAPGPCSQSLFRCGKCCLRNPVFLQFCQKNKAAVYDGIQALQDPVKARIYPLPLKSQYQRFWNGPGWSGLQIFWSHRLVMGRLRCTEEAACPGLVSCVWTVPLCPFPSRVARVPFYSALGAGGAWETR